MTNIRARKVMGLGRLVGALGRDVFVRGGEVNVDGNIIPDREAWHTWEHRGHLIFILHTRRGSQPELSA